MMFRRVSTVLPFLLFVAIATVSVLTPQNAIAQSQSSLPTASCSSGSVDLIPYVAPCFGQGAGDCTPRGQIPATSINNSDRYVGNVSNNVEWVDGTTFKQNSNDIHFLYRVEGGYIKFMQDTIWDGFFCSEDGADAMYRVFDGAGVPVPASGQVPNINNNWGANFLPTTMSCGGQHQYSLTLGTYRNEKEALNADYDKTLQACNVPGQTGGSGTNSNALLFEGPATCNGVETDVAVVTVASGIGQDEVYVYCRDFGLCAWYLSLDWGESENQPENWDASTDVCALEAGVSSGADYYLYPIESLQNIDPTLVNGISLENPNDPSLKAVSGQIAQELIDQGYEVSCTVPDQVFRASFENWESYPEIAQQYLDVQPIQYEKFLDFTNLQYPLFRSEGTAQSTSDSIEAHFGYLDTTSESEEVRDQRSAPIYKLLSNEDQCIQQKKMLATIKAMCDKLEDPNSCALYQEVSGTNYTTQTLYEPTLNLSCDAESQLNATGREAQLYEALGNVPLYLDKAYRLGFIVMVGEQRADDPEANPPFAWNFLYNESSAASSKTRDQVRVIAFKLPDIGTNKDRSSDTYYDDVLALNRDVLTPQLEQEARIAAFNQEREAFKAVVQEKQQLDYPRQQDDVNINCDGPLCADPLGRALVTMLNSGDIDNKNFDPTCSLPQNSAIEGERNAGNPSRIIDTNYESNLIDELSNYEGADTLTSEGEIPTEGISESPTSIADGIGTFFKDSFQMVTNLIMRDDAATTSEAEPPQKASFAGTATVNSDAYIDSGTLGGAPGFVEDAVFRMYLVYPVGYEYEQVVDTLAGTFKTNIELANLGDRKEYEPYFILDGINETMSEGLETNEFPLPVGAGNCVPTEDPITGEIQPCTQTVEYKVLNYQRDADGDDNTDTTASEPRVLGGVLGHLMRDIQLSLRSVRSKSWDYIRSCETTEEFLLGTCAGDPSSDDVLAENLMCEELYGNENMTVYTREETFRKLVAVADQYRPAGVDRKLFAQTLWGILEIEGSPYLRAMRNSLPEEGTQTVNLNCAEETLNSCGAIGPFQIVEGRCTTSSCGSPAGYELLRTYTKEGLNLCDLDTALDWSANNMVVFAEETLGTSDFASIDPDRLYDSFAGSHGGFGDCSLYNRPIQGCNGLNYCDCASEGFSDRFDEMWARWESGSPDQNPEVDPNNTIQVEVNIN